MTKTIHPKKGITGIIHVPGDKSISHRALILSAIAEGVSEIKNILLCNDTMSTITCLRQLGVRIEIDNGAAWVDGVGLYGLKPPSAPLFCGNSGTTMRLLAGLLAGQDFYSTLDGDASLKKRPMERIVEPLSLMGARIVSHGGAPPLAVHGTPLKGIHYKMPINSAQVKSAIQLAAIYAAGQTTIEIPSHPILMRNHTDLMLDFMTEKGSIKARKFHIPGDQSSAAFFIVLGLMHAKGTFVVRHVGLNPTRLGFIGVLRSMGAEIDLKVTENHGGEPVGDIFVKKSRLKPIDVEGDMVPFMIDELPIFAVAAATLTDGTVTISDAAELRVKESDRLNAVITELNKMGASITPKNEGMIIKGGTPLHGATLDAHHDHRIAMSLSIAATAAKSKSQLENAHWANISFPNFFETLSFL